MIQSGVNKILCTFTENFHTPTKGDRGRGLKKPKEFQGGGSKEKHLSWEGCGYFQNNLHVLQRTQDSDKCLSHLRLAALFDMLSLKTKYLTSNNIVQINDK